MKKRKYAIIKKDLKCVNEGPDRNNVIPEMLQYAGKKISIVSDTIVNGYRRYTLQDNRWVWSKWMFSEIIIEDIEIGDNYYIVDLLNKEIYWSIQIYNNSFFDKNNIKMSNCFSSRFTIDSILSKYKTLILKEQKILKSKLIRKFTSVV